MEASDQWTVGAAIVDFANRARQEGVLRLDELPPHVFWISEINTFFWEMQRNGCDGYCGNILFPFIEDRSKLDIKMERLSSGARALSNSNFLDLIDRIHKFFLKSKKLFRQSWIEGFFVSNETVTSLNNRFLQVCDEEFIAGYRSWILSDCKISIVADEMYETHLLELWKLNAFRAEREK